jgi:acyl-CoA hydrolase
VGLPGIGPVQEAIGKCVADLIDDGSTLQIGYGGIPDAVVIQPTHRHDLGIHTEMIGDGILTLVESGAVTNRRKNYLPGKKIAPSLSAPTSSTASWIATRPWKCIP